MNQTVFRYGLFATVFIIGLMSIFFYLLRNIDYDKQGAIGYLTMLLSMVFVFLGLRHYRNKKNNGSLGFWEGLKLGTLIVLLPAACFGLFDVLYTSVINPQWMADYKNYYINSLRQGLTTAQYEARKSDIEKSIQLFSNPLMQFVIMFLTVFVIGFIVTIISALALRRKPVITA